SASRAALVARSPSPVRALRKLPGTHQPASSREADDGGMASALTERRPGADPEAHLLVVEDDPNILELLGASLRYAGFEVDTATEGAEAVESIRRHRPDLVVLDVMLPDMDGFEVARQIRSGGDRTPVLFLTARD